MTKRVLTLRAWAGPATVVIALIGWLVAGVLPIPLGSESSVAQVVDAVAVAAIALVVV